MTTQARSLISRTLWRIETHINRPLTLAELASFEQVSPFHLSRAFSLSIGMSPMSYVRARRLSEAARALRDTDLTVTEIAFDACYDSHEGFTRAFRTQFGCAPSHLRKNPETKIDLQEAIAMAPSSPVAVTPRFEKRAELRLVGLSRRYNMETRAKIPQQWQDAIAEMGEAMYEPQTFGACFDFKDDDFTYMVGIPDDGRIADDNLDRLTLPAGDYAVFEHEGHVSSISDTWSAIFESWMPAAEVTPGEGPEFELYEADFDPETPGGVSVWIPVTRDG